MKYCATKTISIGVTGAAFFSFRTNGLYDPDYAFGGHQPYGRNLMATYYRKYFVYRSTCQVTWVRNNLLPAQCGAFYLTVGDLDSDLSNTWSASGVDAVNEKYGARLRGYWGDPESRKTSVRAYWKCPRVTDETWGANYNADPVNLDFYNFMAYFIPAGAVNEQLLFRVTLWFTVKWYEPRDLNLYN